MTASPVEETAEEPEGIPNGEITVEESVAEEPVEEPQKVIEYPVGNGETYTAAIVLDGNLLNYVTDGDPAQASGMQVMQEKTGVNFDYTVFAMMSDNMTLMISSGDWTDIIIKIDESYSAGIAGALDEEVILDLAPYIDEYAPDYAAVLASDETYTKETFDDEGRLGAFYNFSTTSPSGNVIRKDWLDEAGITEIPSTYDEFEQAALAVMNLHPELESCYPMGSSLIARGYETELEYGYGLDSMNNRFFVNEDGVVDYAWTTDNARAYLTMLAKWVDLGILSKDDMLTGDAISFGNRIYTGDALMKHNNTDAFGPDMMAIAEDPNFELAPAYELTINEGDAIRFGGAAAISSGWSISTTCENPELLIQALNWIYTEEGTITFNFGVEGEAYTMEDGHYKYTDLILNNPDGIPQFFATSIYTGFEMPKVVMPETNEAKLVNDQQREALALWQSQERSADGQLHGDLLPAEVDAVAGYSDIDTYVQEWAMAFAIGEVEITDEAWENYIATIDSMGIDYIIACYQTAYERYLER